MSILNETQFDRDEELSLLTNKPLKFIQDLQIASPDSIRVFDEKKEIPEDITTLYTDYKYLNLIAYFKTLMERSARSRHPELYKLLKETKNKNCLDFGSGVFTHIIALAENNNRTTALDVKGSELMHFGIKRLMKRGLSCHIAYSDEELLNDYYDVIVCSDTLEHTIDPILELKRINKSLKKNGKLFLQVSTMIKPSSGHFSKSIQIWKELGKDYLDLYFIKIGKYTYVKK